MFTLLPRPLASGKRKKSLIKKRLRREEGGKGRGDEVVEKGAYSKGSRGSRQRNRELKKLGEEAAIFPTEETWVLKIAVLP